MICSCDAKQQAMSSMYDVASRYAHYAHQTSKLCTSSYATDVASSYVNMLTDLATETVTIRTFSNQKPWTFFHASVMRLTNALPHTTPVFYWETWATTKHHAMLSDVQLEPLNSDTGRELSHIFSSMTLDVCGRDWRPSVPLEINPPQRWEQIR